MKDIYLTSTFTNQWNVEFNSKIGGALEERGIICYLPHRDTNQLAINHKERFDQDIEGMEKSTMILAISLNESPNYGAELGYSYGKGKRILILTEKDHIIPLICRYMATEIIQVEDMNQIEEYIDLLVRKIKANNT